jgi:hypothetical protein
MRITSDVLPKSIPWVYIYTNEPKAKAGQFTRSPPFQTKEIKNAAR